MQKIRPKLGGFVLGLCVLMSVLMSAEAVIKIETAEEQDGVAFIKGNGAVLGAQITWEGGVVTTANTKNGGFSFVGVLPGDCQGTLSDGAETIAVNVLHCTPVTASQLPATGQTTSLREGDDGDIQAGATLSYTDTGNGTIIDNNTGLEWEKQSDDGSIHDKDNIYNWENAFDVHIAGLNTAPCFAGHCDWRLPNIKELQSIVDYGRSNPSINTIFGPTAAFDYWSSTTDASNSEIAWIVSFFNGNVLRAIRTTDRHVRAVRGGLD